MSRRQSRPFLLLATAALALMAAGCGQTTAESGGDSHAGAGRAEAGRGFPGGGEEAAAVPVEVAPVVRRSISSYIETNGTLEAENEVDVVARTSGPIVELAVEEGMRVGKGQLLARLDQDQIRAQLEISRVELAEARANHERAENLWRSELISREAYEAAVARHESARAQFEGNQILLSYTEIRAPFAGLIVNRYVKFAETVSANQRLFRISDFDPLLCPIQVPERELPLLRLGQRAYLRVEAWPGERFAARVLRLSPVVDAATGTVKVTLEVSTQGKLRPGMFASVFLETQTHEDALVIPKAALSLESIGDTVYVADSGVARRREVRLGFREGDAVEVTDGLAQGEQVVVVGQDSLSDGTPIQVLGEAAGAPPATAAASPMAERPRPAADAPSPGREGPPAAGGGFPGRPDFSRMTPEQLERVKERMRARGLSDQEIEAIIRRAKERSGGGQ